MSNIKSHGQAKIGPNILDIDFFSQFVAMFQVYLIITGRLPKPWLTAGLVTMTDSQGNLLRIPKPTLISLVFSFLSMSKAIYSINVVKGIQFKVKLVRLLIPIY